MSFGRKLPHEELTDPANQKILGTLTSRAWGKLAVLQARARFYNLENLGKLTHPLLPLIDDALQSSGAIGGQHRKDLTEAVKAQPPLQTGFTVQNNIPSTQPPKQEKRRGIF